MEAFVLSFFIIFLAEMGDKSQLMSLAFATRYRAATVLVAITVATLLLNAGSVIVGGLGLALVLTLFLTPVLYDLLAGFSKPRSAIERALDAELGADSRHAAS